MVLGQASGWLLVIAQQKPVRWRDGDRDERLSFAALGVEAVPDVVEALLGFPGDRDRLGRLVLLAALERGAFAGRAAVVPGRLDEEPARVAGAGLRDRALPSLLARAVFGADEPEVVRQLRGVLEAGEVADLGAEPDRGERVDATEAAQPCDRLGPRGERGRSV